MRINIKKTYEINLISGVTTPASFDVTNMAAFGYRSYYINQRTIFIFNISNNVFHISDIKFVAQKLSNDKIDGAFKYSNSCLLNHKAE